MLEHDGTSDSEDTRGGVILDPPQDVPVRARVNPSKYWCATIFNATAGDVTPLLERGTRYIIGNEICPTTKKVHLQCYFEFKTRVRPLERFKGLKAHWERRKGTTAQAVRYCQKENNYIMEGFDNLMDWITEEELLLIIELLAMTENPKKEWDKFYLCRRVLYRQMFVEKKFKPIKDRKRYVDYEAYLYNKSFPGVEFKEVPVRPDVKERVLTELLK